MGIVGKFIDQVCESHPQLMQAVLERPLAPLGEWLDWDKENGVCGCLIGTTALAAGLEVDVEFISPNRRIRLDIAVHAYVAGVLGMTSGDVYDVGMKVHKISLRPGKHFRMRGLYDTTAQDEARTIHLLRQRIARSLVIRQARDTHTEAAERYLTGVR